MARGPAKARTYSATEPLFARDRLKFSGRVVELRAQVPEEYWRSARDRRQFWDHRKVDHAADIPPKKITAASAAPAAPPAATVQAAEAPTVAHVQPKEALEAAAAAARVYGLSLKDFGAAAEQLAVESTIGAEVTPVVVDVLEQIDATVKAEPEPSAFKMTHTSEASLTDAELERLTAPVVAPAARAETPQPKAERRGRSR